MAWYSGDIFEQYMMANRALGPYGWVFWALMLFNVLIPQALWSKRVRTNLVALFLVALSVNLGMWLERFVIVITSLHRDFVPSSWGMYYPTWVDWSIFVGSLSFFSLLFLLFVRFVPAVAVTEVKELRHELAHQAAHAGGGHP